MRRGILGTVLWACLAAVIGVGLFFVKHEVKDQERRLAALTGEIQRNQETIHVLRAEWSYLNDPIRLRALSEKHLGMHPVSPAQVATLDGVLKNGLPAGGSQVAFAARPQRPSPPVTAARPVDPTPPPAPTKLAANQPKPKPADTGKPAPRPTPPKTTTTMAKATPPPPVTTPPPSAKLATAPATTPVRGGRSIVIRSPALAQGEADQ